MNPNSSPESTSGATRSVRSGCSANTAGSQTWIHAFPDTWARATTTASSSLSRTRATSRYGTAAARSNTPAVPVHTSAFDSCMLFFSDSASCSSSSSSGMARRALLAVHPPIRELLEPVACRYEEQCRDRGGDERQSEDASARIRRAVAETEHHDDVHDSDEHDEPTGFDRADEQPVDTQR